MLDGFNSSIQRAKRKLTQFKFFVSQNKLGEVGNKTIPSSQCTSEIFSPKIIKISQYLSKLQLIIDGVFF